MLLLGGSAVISALTGMNVYAAAFLMPFGMIMYILSGGLKATFIASYVHTAVIYIVLVVFSFTVYVSSPDLGSPAKVQHESKYALVWQCLRLLSFSFQHNRQSNNKG